MKFREVLTNVRFFTCIMPQKNTPKFGCPKDAVCFSPIRTMRVMARRPLGYSFSRQTHLPTRISIAGLILNFDGPWVLFSFDTVHIWKTITSFCGHPFKYFRYAMLSFIVYQRTSSIEATPPRSRFAHFTSKPQLQYSNLRWFKFCRVKNIVAHSERTASLHRRVRQRMLYISNQPVVAGIRMLGFIAVWPSVSAMNLTPV